MSMCYTVCGCFFVISSFSDLSGVMSSEQDGDSDEETLDAMEYTEAMVDTEDPDVTVNDDHTVDDVQESHDSNIRLCSVCRY